MVVQRSENTRESWLDNMKQRKTLASKTLLVKSLVVGAVGTVSMMASSMVIGQYNLSNDNSNDISKNIIDNNNNAVTNKKKFMPNLKAPKINVQTTEATTPLDEFLGQDKVEGVERRQLELEGDADIIWLFAFPESGAYHLNHILQTVSQRGMGTNNGKMYLNPLGKVVPAPMSRNNMRLYGGSTGRGRGPPLLSGVDLSPSNTKALVHTDPSGACFNCHPQDYMHNMDEFRQNLWMASVVKDGKVAHIPYDTNCVKGGLHLYRYPFDNIVLRYWAHREQKHVSNHNGWVAKYGASNAGFLEWCNVQDSHWKDTEAAWYGEDIIELTKNVPCHQEFYKYINYYNNVEMIERGAGLEMKRICYEEFYNHYHDTVGELLEFLDLPVVRETPPGGGTNIRMGFSQHYFTLEQKKATYTFLKAIAYPGVKEMMEMFEKNDFQLN